MVSPDDSEKVHVERARWDEVPRFALADFEGAPHYFEDVFDDALDDCSQVYALWPASGQALELEQEQWRVFVLWTRRYEAGAATTEQHPARGGIDSRWDEIQELVRRDRERPLEVLERKAEWKPIDGVARYSESGPDYRVRWLTRL